MMRESTNLYRIVITWKTDGDRILVNFLDWQTKSPLTRQRVYSSVEPVRGFVARSMTSFGGPRLVTFGLALQKGFGEVEVDITGIQYERLRDS